MTSLLFGDSFDSYNSGTEFIMRGWSTSSMSVYASGRNGKAIDPWGNPFCAIPNTADVVVGLASYFRQYSFIIVKLMDGTTGQTELYLNSDGTISIRRNGTVLATTTAMYTTNTWYHIQFRTLVADSGGVAELKINNEVVLTYTGDTKNTTNAYVNRVQLLNGQYADDFYVANGYLGDLKGVVLRPSANGTNSAWAVSGAASQYMAVDDTYPNTTDYIASSLAGSKCDFEFTDPTGLGEIIGAHLITTAMKDDAGSRVIRPYALIDGVIYYGSNISLGSSYVSYAEMFNTNPATGLAWTIYELTNAKFGVEVVS